jgi:hypothetical protein
MPSLESILALPISPEAFYAQVQARLAPQVASTRAQARLIDAKFPELKAATIAQAEQALQGLLILPGTGAKPHFVGNPPRWSDDSLHDNEYIWGLNRMNHWKPLLRAFTLTGNPRYAQKVVDELSDWIKSCPRPPLDSVSHFGKVDPWRSLEVGIRLFSSWLLILPHLLGSDPFTPAVLASFASSVFEQGEVLYYAPPIFFPRADHNHYLMENLGLLAAATLFPEFSTAELWRTHAVRELERCAAAQITAEGGQIEGCPHYHNGCIGWFVQGLTIARTHGLPISPEFVSKMEQAILYSLHCLRPSGTAVPWGDSDADKELATQSILSGYRLFHNPDYLRIAVSCCGAEEVRACAIATAWDHVDTDELLAAIDEAASSTSVTLPADYWAKSLHQAMLRTAWSHDALGVFFACRSPVDNAHAHIDPMGFDFTAHGRPLVVDPGRFTYREDPDRRAFKSAAYHNTLVINGRDPFEYIGSWTYGPQKPGRILDVRLEPGCKSAFARHDNYEPAIHHRAVALIENVALLVIDRVENLRPGDLLQLYFHLDSVNVTWDKNAGGAKTHDAGQANVLIVSSVGARGELLPGRVSDFIDVSRPSTRLRFTAPASEATVRSFATVIVPWPASASEPMVGAPKIIPHSQGFRCEFQLNGRTHSFDWAIR